MFQIGASGWQQFCTNWYSVRRGMDNHESRDRSRTSPRRKRSPQTGAFGRLHWVALDRTRFVGPELFYTSVIYPRKRMDAVRIGSALPPRAAPPKTGAGQNKRSPDLTSLTPRLPGSNGSAIRDSPWGRIERANCNLICLWR